MTLSAARGLLACPVCGSALGPAERALGCARGHRYDLAKQGYVNLLGSAPPANADTAAMVAARERFLATGHYRPIADAVAGRLAHSSVIAEVGAGTGYYLEAALDRNPAARGVAIDVSVAAAKRAAKAHPRAASVVGDVWAGLPLLSRRFAAVLCVFAPRNPQEFARVLTPGGLAVVVTPAPHHLENLRERYALLGVEPDKDDRLLKSTSGFLEPVARTTLDYEVDAAAGDVRDLIS
ncbi:putative RNA methyltransferase [Nigerium massiliense]|uniref:putative RNA methyltransferase n=1 Tax=Nigerium massiliense TaxID=1522317 RepID=UPI000AF681B3|nr:methyltransferase domain-containing protein [Nigerium massiliense]